MRDVAQVVTEHVEEVAAALGHAVRALRDPGPFLLLDLRGTALLAGASARTVAGLASTHDDRDGPLRGRLAEVARHLHAAESACRRAPDLPLSAALHALQSAEVGLLRIAG